MSTPRFHTLTLHQAECGCLYLQTGAIKVYECSDCEFGFWPLNDIGPRTDLTPATPEQEQEVTLFFQRTFRDALRFDQIRLALRPRLDEMPNPNPICNVA